MLFKEIKSKSIEELTKLIADLKAELFTLRFQNATGQLDQSHKINAIKKDIARCFTAIEQLKGEK